MRYGGYYSVGVFYCTLIAFSSIRRIRALDAGASALSVSVGGPITQVGTEYLLLPLLSVGYAYGCNNHLCVEGGVNLTSALFGLAHIDAGVNWYPFESHRALPGLTITPKLFRMSNFKAEHPEGYRIYAIYRGCCRLYCRTGGTKHTFLSGA